MEITEGQRLQLPPPPSSSVHHPSFLNFLQELEAAVGGKPDLPKATAGQRRSGNFPDDPRATKGDP